MWSILKRNIVIVSLALILGASCAWAQNGTTSLRGTITDQKGSSVPGASISLNSAELGISVSMKTDKDGGYQFLEVRPATYTVTVTAAGFATIKQTGLQIAGSYASNRGLQAGSCQRVDHD